MGDHREFTQPGAEKPYARFRVNKVNRVGRDQRRILELNEDTRSLRNYSPDGVLKKEFAWDLLQQLEKDDTDATHLTLRLGRGSSKVYDLYFESSKERERFFVLAHALRSNVRVHSVTAGSAEIAESETVSVFVGTWNMGENFPHQALTPWIPKNEYDLYAIGVQECQYQARGGFTSCEEDWFAELQAHIGSRYDLVASLSLLQIRLAVFVRKEHAYKVTRVRTARVATGVANMYGNKGGVGVELWFHETPMAFINCHLAARTERIAVRNKNVADIIDGLQLGLSGNFDIVNQSHYVFWFGDLNYRVDGLERAKVLQLIKDSHMDELLRHDQLRKELSRSALLFGFEEGSIKFPPTYRYEVGALQPDGTREFSRKKLFNLPSWCDRVLYRAFPGCSLKQETYASIPELITSDHCPVAATFQVEVQLPYVKLGLQADESQDRACVVQFTSLAVLLDDQQDKLDETPPAPAAPLELAFYGQFLERDGLRSEAREEDVQIEWTAEDLPTLKSYISSKDYLARKHVSLALYRGQERVGQAVLSLSGACGEQPYTFAEPLTAHGIKCGVAKGSVHVMHTRCVANL